MELIPGLSDDLTRECLIRVPFTHFSTVASTSRCWKYEIHSPEFFLRRKTAGYAQTFIVMAQSRVDVWRNFGLVKDSGPPVYRLTVWDPKLGDWNELPPIPGFSVGLPMFCNVAGVGSDLVVLGGWDPVTWEVSKSVFVFSFLSGEWRRGAEVPGVGRSLFGCAADSDNRSVLVAGGHDEEKNALRSMLVYDVAEDEWREGPDMARERDECKVLFRRGKFHVVGGYCTDMQGRFESSAEAFDVDTWKWDPVDVDFLKVGKCPRTCVAGDDGALYICQEGDVAKRENEKWKTVAKLPGEICNVAYVTPWLGKLIVIGSSQYSGPHRAYTLDLKGYTWKKMEMPEENSGHVQSGCCLEL